MGELSTEARLVMYEKTGQLTLINNLECWTRIEKKEMERIEKVQGRMLKRLMGLPKSTSTWGILKETGTWTLEMRIMYHRMMLYQSLVNADSERLGREIIEAQQRTGNNGWTRETEKMARRLGIDIEATRTGTKGKWKQTVKERIEEELVNRTKIKEKEMKKLRHGGGFGKKV